MTDEQFLEDWRLLTAALERVTGRWIEPPELWHCPQEYESHALAEQLEAIYRGLA